MRNISWRLREAFGDPIGSYAGNAPVGVRDMGMEMEESCSCGCDGSCGCSTGGDTGLCSGCGMPVESCSCNYSGECESCGMMPIMGSCGCPMKTSIFSEATETEDKKEPCDECGMTEGCGCNMAEGKLNQVAPKGYERIVRALKKEPSVRNPWAVAWSMKNKGVKPKTRKSRKSRG